MLILAEIGGRQWSLSSSESCHKLDIPYPSLPLYEIRETWTKSYGKPLSLVMERK
jgi:hypothetical protein